MTDREVMNRAWAIEKAKNPHTAYNSWCRGYKAALAQSEPFSLVCPTCSADRTKEACKGDLSNCWLKGQAHSAQPEQSKYSDIVSDGGLDPRNKFDAQPEQSVCAPAGRRVNWSAQDEKRLDAAIEKAYGTTEQMPVEISKLKAMHDVCIAVSTRNAQPEQEHQPWCDYLNIMLPSLPPKRAECNCKQAPPIKPWVGLTDEERDAYNNRLSGSGVAEEIDSVLRNRNT